MLRESAPRAGFVDEAQYRTLLRQLRPDLREAGRKTGVGTLPGALAGIAENGARQVGDTLGASR